jgi:hypothetical protein
MRGWQTRIMRVRARTVRCAAREESSGRSEAVGSRIRKKGRSTSPSTERPGTWPNWKRAKKRAATAAPFPLRRVRSARSRTAAKGLRRRLVCVRKLAGSDRREKGPPVCCCFRTRSAPEKLGLEAAEVAETVSPIGDKRLNEAQARELAPVLRQGGEEAVRRLWKEVTTTRSSQRLDGSLNGETRRTAAARDSHDRHGASHRPDALGP